MREMSEDVQSEEINTVQKMHTRNFNDALDRPGYMLAALYESLIQNKTAPIPDDYLAYIDSVSEDDVKSYAKKVNDLVLIKAEYRPQLVLHKQ